MEPEMSFKERTRRPLMLLALASALALSMASCKTNANYPQLVALAKPFKHNALLNPEKLSPGTEAVLREQGVEKEAKASPAAAALRLHQSLADAPPSDPRRLALGELLSNHAGKLSQSNPAAALGWYLDAARVVYPGAMAAAPVKGDDPLLVLYNHACSHAADLYFVLAPSAGQPFSVEGTLGRYALRLPHEPGRSFAPDYFDDMEITEYFGIKGYSDRETVAGLGGTLVGHRDYSDSRAQAEPFLPKGGMAVPVTATLRFSGVDGTEAEMVLHDRLMVDEGTLDGRKVVLAADFTTPLALLDRLQPPPSVGLKAMFKPAAYLSETRLFQIEPHRPGKIPVILVHGLSATPATWIDAINRLRGDPEIRKHYQFLCFRYSSGFPPAFCGAALRHQLTLYRQFADPDGRNPNQHRMVLVGKSFGGILSSLQVRDSGEEFREVFAAKPLAELDLPGERKEALESMLYFKPHPGIRRVVFMVTPHSGTNKADEPLAQMVSRYIRYPAALVTDGELVEFEGMTPLARQYFNRPPNSMTSLKPHSEELEALKKLPFAPGLAIHSIVGKVTKGPLEDSNDKMVPYWSSHLPEALSEIVVPTNHGNITHHPDSIQELRRILTLHLKG